MKKFIYYLPRILSIIIVAFFAMFILEGFGPDFGWQDSVAHLITTLVALGITILAWKKPKVGGWFFIVIGLWFLKSIIAIDWDGGQTINAAPLVLSSLFFVIGTMFLIEGFKKKN